MKPELLVRFDTAVPGNEQLLGARDKVARLLWRFQNEGTQYLLQKAGEKSEYWRMRVHRRAQALASKAYKLLGRDLPPSLRYFQMEEAHWRALRRYTFKPYGGQITLMRAVDRGPEALGKREDPSLGWTALAGGGLKIHVRPHRTHAHAL